MALHRRRLAQVTIVSAALALIAACGGGEASTKPPSEIVIPLLIATSGPQAVYAPYFINSTKMAADAINADGGIGGKTKIKIKTVDTQGEPDKAVAAFSRVYDKNKTPLVLSAFSSQTLALIPIVKQRGAVMMNGGAQNEALGGQAPYLFNTIPMITNESDVLGKYLATKNSDKTAAVLFTDDDGGKSSAKAFEASFKASGGKILGEASGKLNGTDFRSQLATLRSKKPDILFLGVFGATNKTIIDQLDQMGWDVPLANTSWVNVPDVTSVPGAAGMIYSSFVWEPSPAFSAEFKKLSGKDASNAAIGNYYDAVIAFAKAYEQADKKGYGLDGKGIGRAMSEITFTSSYGGTVQFKDGVLDRPIAISEVQDGGASKVITGDATN